MKRAALALLLLAGGTAVQAQDGLRPCSRDVEVREETDWWQADHFSVRWTHWLPDRASMTITAYTYDQHNRHHLAVEGAFSPWSNNAFIVSPKSMRTRGKLWAQLSAGGQSLPPEEVSRNNGFYGIAFFNARKVKDLIGEAPELTITFYDRKQAVVDRYSVARTMIEAGAARMLPVHQEYIARMAQPAELCAEEIILVH